MLIPLCLALLGHLSIATAQQSGSGLRVFPNTGPLSVFPGISWRYNGEVDPWGKESNLDFVPMIKDEATVERMYFAATSWLAKPYISHVFSLDARKPLPILRCLVPDQIAYLNGMLASKGAELQRKISEGISTSGLGQYQLGLPSLSIKHGQVVSTGLEWIRVSRYSFLMRRWHMAEFGQAMWQQCQGDCMGDFFVVDYEGDNAATMAAVLEVGNYSPLPNEQVWLTMRLSTPNFKCHSGSRP